jgi:hypothetical protein
MLLRINQLSFHRHEKQFFLGLGGVAMFFLLFLLFFQNEF